MFVRRVCRRAQRSSDQLPAEELPGFADHAASCGGCALEAQEPSLGGATVSIVDNEVRIKTEILLGIPD